MLFCFIRLKYFGKIDEYYSSGLNPTNQPKLLKELRNES